jgi:DNA topoisomerase I
LSRPLIIVESPAKARTIKKFLGSRYQVVASVGHVRDLPKSRLGVDIEHDFAPTYLTIKGKGDVIKELRSAAKKASKVYLAPDPDREGEAIAWHLAELLKLGKPLRIELHEITKRAAEAALKSPKSIDIDRVNAQQARRVLDRLVGYKLSPLLWRKVRGGLSAGRVQSVAVKLIVDRERERDAFKSTDYWTITARLWPHGHHDREHTFLADLAAIDGEKLKVGDDPTLKDEATATALVERLRKSHFTVKSVETKEVSRNPAPPFTTSTLQQEASRRLKMRVRRTMQIAQGLYEGVDIGDEGTVGLITYMRTDSTRLSGGAIAMARDYIIGRFGEDYSNVKQFKASEEAQDAHEAIRPTDVNRSPDVMAAYLDPSQLKLYRLIWERFVASQMAQAIFDQTTVSIEADGCEFRASGSVLKFPGFTAIYEESRDEDEESVDERKRHLPPIEEGQALDRRGVWSEKHTTQPPPRFTEATLVRTLEQKGIGRPSTYATIVDTIQHRTYVTLEKGRFAPLEMGYIVTDLLADYFPEIVDENFTSDMERKLDRVEDAHDDWKSLLREFWTPFHKDLDRAEADFPKVEFEEETTDEVCSNCGRPMVVKNGRFGKFLACSGYPECKTTKPIVKDAGVLCPRDGGRILERRSRKGRIFWGCENYKGGDPNSCGFVAWDPPIVGSTCAECGAFLVRKRSRGEEKVVCSVDPHHEHGHAEDGEARPAGPTVVPFHPSDEDRRIEKRSA